MSESPTTFMPQTVLAGRYLVRKQLGQGGMGAIYLVEDQQLFNRLCVVKEMLPVNTSAAERAEAELYFEREANLLSQLRHESIPQIYGYFVSNGRYYVVMEWVEGENLADRLARQGIPFDEDEVREWALSLCEVLTYLHTQDPPVIYRDLKPGNVMLTVNNQIKLVDFGIARLFRPGKASDTSSLGTPGYAPPEQYGKGQTDARSDIYALGATLHHLISGREPVSFTFPPVRQLNPTTSASMELIIAKATQSDPRLRYQTADEMRQALVESASASHPTPAGVSLPFPAPATVALSPSVRLRLLLHGWGQRFLGRNSRAKAKSDPLRAWTIRLPRRLDKMVSVALRERNDPVIHEIANIIARKDLPVQGTTFMLRGIKGFGGTELATALKKESLSLRRGLALVATVPLSNPNALPGVLDTLTIVLNSLKRDGGGIRWRLRRAIRRAHAQMWEAKYRQAAKVVTDSQLGLAAASFSVDTPKTAFGFNIGRSYAVAICVKRG